MKTKQEIIELLEAAVQTRELANLQMDDVLAETFDYIRSSRDERAEMEAQFSDPEERKKHEKPTAYFDKPVEMIKEK